MADLGYEFGELCDNMLVHMFCSIHVLLSLSTPAKCGGFFLRRVGTPDPIRHVAVVAHAACSG